MEGWLTVEEPEPQANSKGVWKIGGTYIIQLQDALWKSLFFPNIFFPFAFSFFFFFFLQKEDFLFHLFPTWNAFQYGASLLDTSTFQLFLLSFFLNFYFLLLFPKQILVYCIVICRSVFWWWWSTQWLSMLLSYFFVSSLYFKSYLLLFIGGIFIP